MRNLDEYDRLISEAKSNNDFVKVKMLESEKQKQVNMITVIGNRLR